MQRARDSQAGHKFFNLKYVTLVTKIEIRFNNPDK